MEKFMSDIYDIYELINNDDDSRSFIKVKTTSKQYLAYYLYRIITKYMDIFDNAVSSEIKEFIKLLRIPEIQNIKLTYPLVGKMIHDEQILDVIILTAIDIFNKTNKYFHKLNNTNKYVNFFEFLEEKNMTTILKDIIDLQKLIPGLSAPIIRPNINSLNSNNRKSNGNRNRNSNSNKKNKKLSEI